VSQHRRVAFLGNSPPRRCGIATFTNDLQQAIAATGVTSDTAIVAMTDEGCHYDYPPVVLLGVHEEKFEEYERAAQLLNAGRYDVVCLQHEFGIFGGDAGSHVITLLAALAMPIVTTLHTILAQPSPVQRRVLREIVDLSTIVVVMADKGRELLRVGYDVAGDKVEIIPHGIPACAFVTPEVAKLSRGFAGKAVALLTDDARRLALRKLAYTHTRSMTWQRTAERYLTTLERAISQSGKSLERQSEAEDPFDNVRFPPRMQLSHLFSMCDATGLYRHAIHSVPDRSHGYCVADNARALLLACALNTPAEERLPEALTTTFAAFVQQAWNPATRRFRDFMTLERRWLAAIGSEDSHGRTLWALGESASNDPNPGRSCWAAALLVEAAPIVESFQSPRAWAFTLLGLEGFRATFPQDTRAAELQHVLANRLMALLVAVETPSWVWLQDGLFDDNTQLPQALIVTGVAVGNPTYVAAGLRSLRWITALQTAENGFFRPVGRQCFGDIRRHPREFDQQPLEASATVSACLVAWRADADPHWKAHAARAFEWFLGNNDLSTPLIDERTGSCRDGLHPGRADENMGGESVVSYLLALAEIRSLVRSTLVHSKPELLRALRGQAH
jgi:Glycosyltransferase Family 4